MTNNQETEKTDLTSQTNITCNLLNVLVYSKNYTARNNLLDILKKSLHPDRYTMYPISGETLSNGVWKGKTALMAIEGKVEEHAYCLVDFFLNGGKILVWNSDLITKIIRNDSDDPKELNVHLQTDFPNNKLNVEIINLGEVDELTVIKVADSTKTGIVLHCQNVNENSMHRREMEKNIQRLLKDVGFNINESQSDDIQYTPAYFLGEYEKKMALVYDLKKALGLDEKYLQKIDDLIVQWCIDDIAEQCPSSTFLPVYLTGYPDYFSYGEYFKNLTSRSIGKLLIYADVLPSTMDIARGSLGHGIAVVASRQMQAKGRSGNAWITPVGQAAITVQIWQKLTNTLPLLQHAAALAVVRAIRQGDYELLNIRIKWPNDVYYGRDTKIGGIISTASCMGQDVIVNIGTGVNISNTNPTICLNMIVEQYNQLYDKKLPYISIETFLAKYCSELEKILDMLADEKGATKFLEEYYKYWLHSDQKIKVMVDEEFVEGVITGMDDAGWLVVKTQGEVVVAPDGNTFDMLHGLVVPKK